MSAGYRNADWYNRNELRSWPLDETATMVDDRGRPLPENLIVDIQLLFPRTSGYRAFIGGLTVSDQVVTVVLVVAGAAFQPLASISVLSPVDTYRQYALSPALPGTGGWITFGRGIETHTGSWRFSAPEQSLLMAKRARPYGPPPVFSLGSLGVAAGLTGLVRLSGGTDVTITAEERDIAGAIRTAAVFRLANKLDESRQVLSLYSGPCGARPETGNCAGPPPIEGIGSVRPDCCGNIFVEFRGCGELTAIQQEDGCGVLLDCPFSLEDACLTTERLPDSSGRLPSEYDSECLDFTDTTPPGGNTSSTTPEPPSGYEPDTAADPLTLPAGEDFQASLSATEYSVVSPSFLQRGGLGGKYGYGLGGNVAKIVADPTLASRALVVCDAPHHLAVGDRVLIQGSSVADNNRIYTLETVHNPGAFGTDSDFTQESSGGSWVRLGTSYGPGIGGGNVGSIVSVTEDLATGDALFTFGEPHNLVAGDEIAVTGCSVSGYNTGHEVQAVRSATAVVMTANHTADSLGGTWTHDGPGSGGRITSCEAYTTGRLKVTFAEPVDLAHGDMLMLIGCSDAAACHAGFVQRRISSTEVVLDTPYLGSATGGIWKLIGYTDGLSPGDTVLQSEAAGRAIAIWSSGLPATASWSSWHQRIRLMFAMTAGPPGSKTNGGVVFNYRDNNNYWLANVEWTSSGRFLELWRVQAGDFTLLQRVTLGVLTLNVTYRMLVDILPFNINNSSSAYVSVRLAALEEDFHAQLGPIEVPNYLPANGKLGVHSNSAITNFDDLAITHL